jgi:ABC-2 type transport system ATP-binding protein
VQDVTVNGTVVRCELTGSVAALIRAAAVYDVVNVVSTEPDLEEIFLAYYREDVEKGGARHAAA